MGGIVLRARGGDPDEVWFPLVGGDRPLARTKTAAQPRVPPRGRNRPSLQKRDKRMARKNQSYLYALTEDDALVYISDARRDEKYVCVGCRKSLHVVFDGEKPLRFHHAVVSWDKDCSESSWQRNAAYHAIVDGWRNAKSTGTPFPITVLCGNCDSDARVMDAAEFDCISLASEREEGSFAYNALWGEILAKDKYGWVAKALSLWRGPSIAFWGGRTPIMAIDEGNPQSKSGGAIQKGED